MRVSKLHPPLLLYLKINPGYRCRSAPPTPSPTLDDEQPPAERWTEDGATKAPASRGKTNRPRVPGSSSEFHFACHRPPTRSAEPVQYSLQHNRAVASTLDAIISPKSLLTEGGSTSADATGRCGGALHNAWEYGQIWRQAKSSRQG